MNVILIAFIFSISSGFLATLVNISPRYNEQEVLSGIILEKNSGKYTPSIVIDIGEQRVTLNIQRSIWNKISVGDNFSELLNKGCLGFYYRLME